MGISKKKTAVSSIILLLIPMINTQIGYSSTIDQVKNHQSLQVLINNAQPGSQILVEPGIYQGPITIDKPLQLIAKGEAVIDGNGNGDVVTLQANGVELKGFTIRNSGTDLNLDDAGIKVKSNNNLITDNSIFDDLHGIYLKSVENNQITNNQIVGIKKLDINDRGNGIHFFHSKNNKIEHNQISVTRDGMYFSYSDNNQVDHNLIHDVRYGLHYMYSNDNSFVDNLFTHNTGGAALMYSHGITLENNTFENHRGDKGTGIVLNACSDSTIKNNKIINNTRAIFMDSSERDLYEHNFIANNFIGLELPNSSSANKFYENTWIANDVTAITDNNSETNEWYNKETKKGNFWMGSELVDLNRDGVSDIPFHITTVQTYLIGQFPDLRFLQDSPAMQLLDFIYKQFPIFQIPSPVDKYPLMKPPAN